MEHRDRELALLGMVLSRLPHPLRSHCRDVTLDEGILTLFLDSPAWVTRARFLIEDLTRSLESAGIVKIATQVRIRAEGDTAAGHRADPLGESVAPTSGINRLSDRAIAHLLGAAHVMPDPTLAEIFRRFANHHAPAARAAVGDRGDESQGSSGAGKTVTPKAD